MDDILYKLIGQAITGVLGALTAYLGTMYRIKKKENDALKTGVQALLRDRIIQSYNHGGLCTEGHPEHNEHADSCHGLTWFPVPH